MRKNFIINSSSIRDSLLRAYKDGFVIGTRQSDALDASSYINLTSHRIKTVEREMAEIDTAGHFSPSALAELIASQVGVLREWVNAQYGERLSQYTNHGEYVTAAEELLAQLGAKQDTDPNVLSVLSLLVPDYSAKDANARYRALHPATVTYPVRKPLFDDALSPMTHFGLVCSRDLENDMMRAYIGKNGDLRGIDESRHEYFRNNLLSMTEITDGLRGIYERHYSNKYTTFSQFVFDTINLKVVPYGVGEKSMNMADYPNGYIKVNKKREVMRVIQLRNSGGSLHDYSEITTMAGNTPRMLLLKESVAISLREKLKDGEGIFDDNGTAVGYVVSPIGTFVTSAKIKDINLDYMQMNAANMVNKVNGIMMDGYWVRKNCTVGLDTVTPKEKPTVSNYEWFTSVCERMSKLPSSVRVSLISYVVHVEDQFSDNVQEILAECSYLDDEDRHILTDAICDGFKDTIRNIFVYDKGKSVHVMLKSGVVLMHNCVDKHLMCHDTRDDTYYDLTEAA